ncbi:DUF5343 domain-containing protein [Amycolatopsis sp. NPDC059657]|uniref:DUF5343 domain-containing protein n=1 Tax=Amycolatopsis sp. NPDC059657 TaxID=3346899 RepID=UPI0036710971
MANEFPYMMSVTNLPAILAKIRSAATPPKFTHEFLKANLGFNSSNDRAVIKLLKEMGFLTSEGTPTDLYNQYRGANSGVALATGIRKAYATLFLSDERAYERSGTELLGIVRNASGAGDAVARKIATTFKSLASTAAWTEQSPPGPPNNNTEETASGGAESENAATVDTSSFLRLHHDVHLHLPPTSDVSVYRAIFQAVKSELM